ncbi:hypothetical protein [Roseateles oligotrophus]|uniref:Dipeptidylpeptidase IV N-terminal domain-containing protein n=1 Tax=Roseateles oligotrophus TaxID=1769250 RepID=A0ABT2YLI5_9BURK|nr:hypothetical protein [Roseateles oligotrophus]MCV2370939.1 hypothetical protein [Roseateles oligotrophus]
MAAALVWCPDKQELMMKLYRTPHRFIFIFIFILLQQLASGVAWSADSIAPKQKLLFVTLQGGGAQIASIDADGSHELVLTTGPGENTQAAWSPDGQRIVFTSSRGGAAPQIYLMNADGSQQTRLTEHALPNDSATWSPDGQRIAFRSYRDRKAALYSMAVDGTQLRQLTTAESDKGNIHWSPDGRQIAYEVYGDKGSVEFHVMKADGADDRDVSSALNKYKKTQLSWSPDSSKLMFVSIDAYHETHIHVVSPDGSRAVQITQLPFINTQPVWSPDGRRIAFVSNRTGGSIGRSAGDIFLMNADGSGVVNLTRHPANDDEPKWSVDGRTLFFLSMRNGPPQLHAIDLEGGPARRLTTHTGQDLMYDVAPVESVPGKSRLAAVNQPHQASISN